MRERVLVLGGYGAIGTPLAHGLAQAGMMPLLAGRDGAAAAAQAARLPVAVARELDVGDPDTVAATVQQDRIEMVVNATGREDPDLALAAVRAGAHFADVSASPGYVQRLQALDAAARHEHRTILASVGLAPGLSNVAAARLHELTTSAPLEITVLLGLGEDHGDASRRWTLRQIGRTFPDPVDGHPVRTFSDPRAVSLPGGLGRRPAYRVASADATVLTRHLGVPVTTRYAFDPAWAARAAGIVGRIPGIGRTLATIDARLPATRIGTDRWALTVASPTHRWGAWGRSQSHATGRVGATAIRHLLERPLAGVHHLHEVITLAQLQHDLPGEIATTPIPAAPRAAPRPAGRRDAVACDDIEIPHQHDEATVIFVDLAGFTALTADHGDDAAVHVAGHFVAITDACLRSGDRLVKTLGDAVLLACDTPEQAVSLVARILTSCADQPDIPDLRVGMHHGPVFRSAHDIFGDTVNVAARVAARAEAGQILATETVARQTAVAHHTIATVTLRGTTDPVTLHELDVTPGAT